MKHPATHVTRSGDVNAINPVTGQMVRVGYVQPRPHRTWQAMREGWRIGQPVATHREAVEILLEHVYGKDES